MLVACMIGAALPLLDASVVDVLAAGDAVCDVGEDGIEILLADAAFFHVDVLEKGFAVFLELRFEEAGVTADEVFVDGEATVDVGNSEADGFAAETTGTVSIGKQIGENQSYLMGSSLFMAPRDLVIVMATRWWYWYGMKEVRLES